MESTVLIVVGVLALVLLGLLIWGAKNPLVWWLLCVIGTGLGTGMLVWGLLMRHHSEGPGAVSPAAIVGAGAGLLAGSVVLFVAAIIGSCSRRRQ
jgi:hypothetical protein